MDDRYGSGEVYDIVSKGWSAVAPMSHSRSGAAVLAVDNSLLVLGGLDGDQVLLRIVGVPCCMECWLMQVFQSVEIYSPQRKQWSAGPPLCVRRFAMTAVCLGEWLVVAGGSSGKQHTVPLSAVYLHANRQFHPRF